jgi:hypothetical protein
MSTHPEPAAAEAIHHRALSPLLAGLALSLAAPDAAASGVAAAAEVLAIIGLAGGAVCGALAAWYRPGTIRFANAFLIYLGVLCAVASTWAESLEIVPLTLVFGSVAGILPFAAGFLALRRAVGHLRAHRRAKAAPPE